MHLLIDCKRSVDFYWLRGEERIPAGHRKGHIDALRYQINDKPHNQIRISKQLPEVRVLYLLASGVSIAKRQSGNWLTVVRYVGRFLAFHVCS